MSFLAEQNIIGSLLIDKTSIDSIYGKISPEMFTSELLGRIFLEFQRGYDNHYDVNPVTIMQKISSDVFPEGIVREELKDCAINTVTSTEIASYADVIAKDYKAQNLTKIITDIRVSSDKVNEQISSLISDLESLQDNKTSQMATMPEIVNECKGNYFVDKGEEKNYIGFPKLDDLLGGLRGGDVIVIGARPAVGKSAFVTQITSNLADRNKRIGFYSLEMQKEQCYERFVVAKSGIGLTRLCRAKNFLGDEKERFDKANVYLENKDNIIITVGSKTVGEIRSESRHMGYDVIIVDYLQLVKVDKAYRGNRYAEVGEISHAFKALAMELNIPIIILSQLNRVSEGRETKEPTMAELRESGDIEQDASVIILLWNISADDESKKGCKIEKQRQGKKGKVVLNFNGDLMQFEETDESVKEAQSWKKLDNSTPFD